MTIIEKKLWPDYFDNDREKPIDLKLADFDLAPGDIIKYREWNPVSKQYTGREYEKIVADVTKNESPTKYWPQPQLEEHGIYVIIYEKNNV